MAIIVIDPGHGGDTSVGGSSWNNAVGPRGTLEKNLVMDIAHRMAAILRDSGREVVLTRQSDTNLGLAERARVAKRLSASVFVSVHLNASPNNDAQGTETIVHTNHSQASAKLSLHIQDALLPVTGHRDRNRAFHPSRIKTMGLGVLNPINHAANTAACLSEASFMDRDDEEARLLEPEYRAAIAEAHARGIEEYLSTAGVLQPDHGDSIEMAAAGASLPVETFLGLDDLSGTVAGPDAMEGAEDSSFPGNAFPAAFLASSAAPHALTASLAGWPEYADFASYIRSLNLRYFEPDEFLTLGGQNASGRCKNQNAYPPSELWTNIRNTALMLDEIRHRMGAAIRITSCYRSPAYNECIGGARSSQHLRFNAIDFVCRAGTSKIWQSVAQQLATENPAYSGWIGHYPSFVHIDTRNAS